MAFAHRPVDYTVRRLSRRALAPLLAAWLAAAPAALEEPPAPGARLDALIGKLQARECELSLPEAREGLGLARQLKNPRAELDFQQVLIQNALQTGEYQQVVQQGVDFNDGQIRVPLSLGVSVVTPDRSLDAVLSAADEAMNLATRSGKDCVAGERSPGIFRLANRTLSSDGSSLRPAPC